MLLVYDVSVELNLILNFIFYLEIVIFGMWFVFEVIVDSLVSGDMFCWFIVLKNSFKVF